MSLRYFTEDKAKPNLSGRVHNLTVDNNLVTENITVNNLTIPRASGNLYAWNSWGSLPTSTNCVARTVKSLNTTASGIREENMVNFVSENLGDDQGPKLKYTGTGAIDVDISFSLSLSKTTATWVSAEVWIGGSKEDDSNFDNFVGETTGTSANAQRTQIFGFVSKKTLNPGDTVEVRIVSNDSDTDVLLWSYLLNIENRI